VPNAAATTLLQGCSRLRESCLAQLLQLHSLVVLTTSMALSEGGLAHIAAAAGTRLALLQADTVEAADGAAAAAAVAATAAPSAFTGHSSSSIGGGQGGSGSGAFGQLGPQLPALRVLQLRRLPSVSPVLWQLAPRLTELVVSGEASNAGLSR
jgi:hypothetical protein